MDEQKFLELLEQNILTGEDLDMETSLTDMRRWDSIAVVTFIALMNLDYELTLNPLDVDTAKTVRELYELVQEAAEE